MKLIQEMHLDKHGQRVIDAIHRDIGTSYADLYATFRTARGFQYAMRKILNRMRALGLNAAGIIAGMKTMTMNAMEVGPKDIYIRANIYPKLPPMEVNVQIMEEATP